MPTPLPDNPDMDLPRNDLAFDPSHPEPGVGQREWVLADARGGFAMGTAQGTPTRRYHAMLTTPLAPPVRRWSMLTAIDEHLHVPVGGQCSCDLGVHLTPFCFASFEAPPKPSVYLHAFIHEPGRCAWDYAIPTQVGIIRVRKTLTLAQRADACRIEYEIESGVHSPEPDDPVTLTLRPLLAMRDFHELNHPGTLDQHAFRVEAFEEPAVQALRVTREGLDRPLTIRGVHLDATPAPDVWRDLRYEHETQRGQSDREDLFCPGAYTCIIEPGSTTSVVLEVTLSDRPVFDWEGDLTNRRTRVRSCIDHALVAAGNPDDPSTREHIAQLASAGDDFVVDRVVEGINSRSIIAGYPWFSDWGRDTMISLPGLLLTTGRFEEARLCLRTFAAACRDGLIPNRFDDFDGPAHYNTVDAPLWFVHACDRWAHATGMVLDPELVDACDDIIDAYTRGTINKIGLDTQDALIRAGDAQTQLTWMDALRNGIAFTPRHGKPVEINALWINALRARAGMGSIGESCVEQLHHLADHAQRSMLTLMGDGPHGGLVDCITPVSAVRSFSWQRSDECRPNQVFACSLPHLNLPWHVLEGSLGAIDRMLRTPVGLRTLSPDHPNYEPHYRGDMMQRDRAYHNGTVWPWLLGAYCEGVMRHRGYDEESRVRAGRLLIELSSQMQVDSIGSLFEIYDAEPDAIGKHAPQGCPAQAWSIAETLRVLVMSSKGGD
ncbi:MAG: amylo-alpha-1,6-glucosidase [Phycisphaerales bacterium JB052]